MISEPIKEKLQTLKLLGILEYLESNSDPSDKNAPKQFETLEELLDVQLEYLSLRRQRNLQAQAKLRWQHALISKLDYGLYPKLSAKVIEQLADCVWIQKSQHVILIGPTGVGKTFLACALANQALSLQHSVLFYRFNELILNLANSKHDGTLKKLVTKLVKAKLLVIDDWLITQLLQKHRHLLFELIESRDQKGSLLITSQYPISKWHAAFHDPTIADSVLDRIVHNAHHITLEGESIRKLQGIQESKS